MVGVAAVPADEHPRADAARQVLTRDPEPPVDPAGGVHDRGVVRRSTWSGTPGAADRTPPRKSTSAGPNGRQHADDRLHLHVVRGHAVAHQAVRSAAAGPGRRRSTGSRRPPAPPPRRARTGLRPPPPPADARSSCRLLPSRSVPDPALRAGGGSSSPLQWRPPASRDTGTGRRRVAGPVPRGRCAGSRPGDAPTTLRKWWQQRAPRRSRSARATSSIPRSVSSSRRWARSTACSVSHRCGVVPVSATNRRAKLRSDIQARRARSATECSTSRCSNPPVQGRGEAVRRALRDRLLDELALPAVALRGHDHAACDEVDDGAAELAADQVQGRVDAGGRAGARDEVPVVDEQHVRVDDRRRVAGAQLVDALPVRGAPAAVEQAGRPEHEHPGQTVSSVAPAAERRAGPGGPRPGTRAAPSRGPRRGPRPAARRARIRGRPARARWW